MKYPGTDTDFREWLQTQPSCISGRFSEYLESGEGRSIACHVRRASDAGTGYKPAYSAVPMTFVEHHVQSTRGELAVLKSLGITTVDEAKAWFAAEAAKHVEKWLLARGW